MTCAVAELQEIAREKRRNRAVYWHRQDEVHFRESGELHIRFCYLPPERIEGDTSCIEQQIGEQVFVALRKAGLHVQWDGDPSKCILVTGIAHHSISGKDDDDGKRT